MRKLALGIVIAGVLQASVAGAEDVVQKFVWSGSSFVQGMANDNTPMAIEGKTTEPAMVLTLADPGGLGVGTPAYAFTGEVRYEGVEGDGYVEMWSHFSNGGRYFSRTLAKYGPTKSLAGTSGWRPFAVPFFLDGSAGHPVKLVLRIVLPGKGKVEVRSLRLVQYRDGEDPFTMPGQWWGDRVGGIIGGCLGGLFGCLCGLAGILMARVKARGFVTVTLAFAIVVGLTALVAGFVALGTSQSFAVWFPLILPGAILSVVSPVVMLVGRKRYRVLELRRMQAMDAK